MGLMRKINEFMHGRVLVEIVKEDITKNKFDELNELCKKADIVMNANDADAINYALTYKFNGGYKFKGVLLNNPNTHDTPWLEYIQKDYSANFVNAPSWAIFTSLNNMLKTIMPKNSYGKARYEIYANVKGEKHYFNMDFFHDLNYKVKRDESHEEQHHSKLHLKSFMSWYVKKKEIEK
ncbi:MAG: hypothetical protein WC758_03335 [Candidatus Woesearchaeota archaeon]